MSYATIKGLSVDTAFQTFVEGQCLPGTGVTADQFWTGFAGIVRDFAPRNAALLAKRAELQTQVSEYFATGKSTAPADQETFLKDIGYLAPEGPDFQIDTANVDPEIAQICGPQLVVPITNARFALNACNARWGSLYDALYGTDALGDLPQAGGFDPERGARVIAWAKAHLDEAAPLNGAAWADITDISIDGAALALATKDGTVALADAAQFVGHSTDKDGLQIYLSANGLLIEIRIDASTQIGKTDPAGISDIRLESALSTIMDCEDSVAAVDAEDKILAYTNWMGLMKGDLSETFSKGGSQMTRRMSPDIAITNADGTPGTLKGRALMLVRNVGHLMTTPVVLDENGAEIGEGLLDAAVTVMLAMHDLSKSDGARNSTQGSVYIVKPKMHGPEEVTMTDDLFTAVEAMLGLPQNTVKLGIMDEERRTSANLRECIRAAKHRVAFINTGFLDRTGDEMHTAMQAGTMMPKAGMKSSAWLTAYENRNVDIGLACGLAGRAQIGKGMWAVPDQLAEMLRVKSGHPQSGANCAWVPSPTAATLHATHYHKIDVKARQAEITAGGARSTLAELLTLPLTDPATLTPEAIASEVDNNAQGILGYVVRWVDHGVGCSKVPDINDVGQMEDRATCRISSQLLANWLEQSVVTEAQVMDAMRRMAAKVDAQNAGDPTYKPMAGSNDSLAFQAACDLVIKGTAQPSGYTEPLLHAYRARVKAQ